MKENEVSRLQKMLNGARKKFAREVDKRIYEVLTLITHKKYYNSDKQKRYLCNQAIIPRERKMSFHWKWVNCKNCLKQR